MGVGNALLVFIFIVSFFFFGFTDVSHNAKLWLFLFLSFFILFFVLLILSY